MYRYGRFLLQWFVVAGTVKWRFQRSIAIHSGVLLYSFSNEVDSDRENSDNTRPSTVTLSWAVAFKAVFLGICSVKQSKRIH